MDTIGILYANGRKEKEVRNLIHGYQDNERKEKGKEYGYMQGYMDIG